MTILPINKQPYARAYNSTAFPLSILFAEDNSLLPYFLNRYIQVNKDLDKSINAMYNFYHYPLYYFNWECFETQLLRKFNLTNTISNIMQLLENNIDAGYYIISYLDEFYISNRWCTEKEHFIHDSLLYGYDDKNYYILGYNSSGQYDTTLVEKNKYIHALLSDKNINNLDFYNVSQFVAFIRIKHGFNENISLKKIKDLINDYLLSVNTAERLGLDENFHENYVFGIKTFEYLANEILLDNKYVDLRLIRLFYEHKYVMLMRMEYLEIIYPKKNFFTRYQEIERFAKIIFNSTLKYSITKDKQLKYKISDNILELLNRERIILTDFINSIN